MYLCLRHALSQVGEVAIAEDRVSRAPHQQRGYVKVANPVGHCRQGRVAGMARAHGNVLDEITDGRATIGRRIRRMECASHSSRHPRAAQRGGDAQKDGQPHGVERTHRAEACRGNDLRDATVRRLMHRRVGEYKPAHLSSMGQCPAQRNGSAPVMRENHDRSFNSQGCRHSSKVIDALSQAPLSRDALTEAHSEVVDRHHPHIGRRRLEHAAPQVGPRRIAMDRKNCQSWLFTSACGIRVEQMPRASDTIEVIAGHQARPRWV